ncbi:MAG TPA: ABC transporter permease [Amycolatopsis sp.]|nr:ABC transporter permease [Amycolatopsis sp.]
MSTSYAVTDSLTMLRRNLKHALRYPSLTVGVVGQPVLLMLLFVYVFGGAMKLGGGATYVNYLVPGMLMMTAGSATMPAAIGVCSDMSEGIVSRFRTMPIARVSLLTGHVVGNMIQMLVSLVLVLGVSFAMGFRPEASFGGWLLVVALLVLLSLALTWLAVALGLVSKTPEAASNIVLPISLLLPFISSAFVPVDSMPAGVRWFAHYQPFTPIIETLRGLLNGTPVGSNWIIALVWCAGIAIGGYLWAKKLFTRDVRR